MSTSRTTAPLPTAPHRRLDALYSRNTRAVVARGLRVIGRNNWLIMVTGFFEPVFYLLSMGYGLGALIGNVSFHGHPVPYAAYIAPALLAVSAMNGAVMDSTMNVFFKMHYAKLYDGMLATSLGPLDVALGEIALALFRGLLYAVGFLIITSLMGLMLSWTAILSVPAVLLIAFGFASFGMAVTSYMKTFQHLDYVFFVLMPMFLLSATFFPITVYPPVLRVIIECLPLWHAVEMIRMLTTGIVNVALLWHALYFVVMIVIGLVFSTRRLRALFLA